MILRSALCKDKDNNNNNNNNNNYYYYYYHHHHHHHPKLTWAEEIRGLMEEKGLMEEDWNDREMEEEDNCQMGAGRCGNVVQPAK